MHPPPHIIFILLKALQNSSGPCFSPESRGRGRKSGSVVFLFYLKKHELQVIERGFYSPPLKIAASSWEKIFRTGFLMRQGRFMPLSPAPKRNIAVCILSRERHEAKNVLIGATLEGNSYGRVTH
jgi:hypothetical protein